MRGIVFLGDSKLDVATFPDPTPGPGEVVLEIKASGMCGSDLHFYRSSLTPEQASVIRGHEPCGIVVAVGPGVTDPNAVVGARVMQHHYQGCSGCSDCHSGWPQMCSTQRPVVYGTDVHGAHAPYMVVPANTLVPLDERLSFEAGAAISCGTGTAWGAFDRMELSGRDTLAVFGQGPVGLSALLLAKAQGARVLAIDIDDSRLAVAKQMGADFVVNSRDGNAVEAIKDLTGGGATKALETSGAKAAGDDALRCVRPWGTVGLVGLGSDLTFSLSELLRRQLKIVPSWTMSIQAQKACADFVIERGIDLDATFSDRWSIDQAEEAYANFNKQSGGKGVFLF
ncbi:zinc-dependent alcohol dehydrogenase family protein [Sphingobium bisphenolivorans]|uniref:zinc-dependent alcohol dehydrogenase family protein n=1 Tax=Sphingobium bisphenolivorans TaxID=1335760 RepID=UPI00039EAB7F|nr:zinc-binding dehydrogenase [Sphingobium bisphenolivorans]